MSSDQSRSSAGTRAWWIDLAIAVAAVAVATLARLALDAWLGEYSTFVTYFAAVTVVAWFGSTPAALFTLVLSGATALYLFVTPRYAFAPADPKDLVLLSLYMAAAAVVVGMSHAMRSARKRGEQLLAEVLVRHEELRRSAATEAEQRERLRTTLESIGDAVITTDTAGRVTNLNAVAEALTGWTNADAAGRPLADVFHIVNETTRLPVPNPATRALHDGVIVGLANHTVLIGKDGVERPIDDSAAPIRSATGEVLGCVLVFRDITERHLQDAELRASEARFRELADAMPQIVYAADAEGRVVFVNRQWLEYTGQTDAQTADLASVVHPEDLDDMVSRWDEAKARGTTLQAEFRLRSAADEEYRWFLTRAVPVRDAGGRIVRWFGTSTDIDEQKQIARRLAESEALYRAIGESIDFGVWVCDAEGRNTYASESFLRMVGITQRQCSDFGWGDVLHPDDSDATIAAWKECVRTQGNWDREHRFKGVDGQWHHVLARGVPRRSPTGEILGWAGINLDITRLVRTEREYDRLTVESERQRRLYETILSSTPDFVYVFSLDHRVLYANEALIRMWGRGREGAIGKTFLEIGYEPWHAAMHEREIDQVRATRQPIRGEVPFDGTHGRRQYDYIFVPILGADGEVEAVAGTTRDVTERKEVEKQLRESEERSAFVRRSSGVGFWYCDLPFDVLEWDELVKAHFHLPPDASVKIETFYDRLHPDDREPTRRAIDEAIHGRTPYRVDYRTVHPDTGAVTWVRAMGRTFYADDGTPTRFDGVTLDVSDQKLSEERQTFLMQLADTLRPLNDPVEVQAEASRILGQHLRANRVLYFEIRGDEYLIERDYTAGVQPLAGRYPVAAFGSALLAHLLDGRTIVEVDATTAADRPADERAAFASIQVRGHVDVPLVKGGRFVAGMTVQVSAPRAWTRHEIALIEEAAQRTWAAIERVRAEREVARLATEADRERRLFAAVLSSTPDFIYTFDLAGRFVYVNAALLALWGKQLDEAVGRNFFELDYPPDLAARLQRQIQQVIDTKRPIRDETPFTSGLGERIYEYIFVPVIGASDAVEAVAGSTRDITDRKLAEAERERLVNQLRKQDQRKDEFLATLAHELRNPLAPIRNGLHLMRMAGASGTIEQTRSMMERQLGQMTRLVDDLLDVSRVTSGKLQLRKERVELRAVIEAAVETSRPAIEQAGHDLAVIVPEEPIHVDCDPVRLAQVVSNLLTNSARYTHRGGHIRVRVRREGAEAVVSVADNGIGIPTSMLEAVFGMFTQVDRTLEKTTGGLGIGLSLVKGLVEMHGGTVAAHSDGEGRGSEFAVRLPVPTTVKSAQPTADEPVAVVRSNICRILVVDDNVDAADSLAQVLTMLGNEVRTAYDGEAGVEAARRFRPDVVLCDIGMPKVNGYDVARRIRAEEWARGVVLVALTGWGQDDDRKKSADAGFDHHLVKPVEGSTLMKLLTAL